MDFWSRHPSVRLLVPLITGIVGGEYLYYKEWASVGLPIFVGGWLWLLLAYKRHLISLFGVVSFLLWMGIGYVRMCQQQSAWQMELPEEQLVYQVQITDVPEEKAKTWQCKVKAEAVWLDHRLRKDLSAYPDLILYIAKDSLASHLLRGDRLWVYTSLKRPVKNEFPGGFDYARYLRLKGIGATGYVAVGQWRVVSHHDERSLQQWAQDARSKVGNLYQRLGFQGDERAILSALTIGEKEDLSEEIKETYAAAGASHVLALSGLHVGLIYGFFWLIFSPLFKRWPVVKKLWVGVMLLMLWTFAFFTGFSTSVVRAVFMCSLLLLLSFRQEPVLSVDTLLTAAFFMLLLQPLWLFDVGFQLSFAAVAAILWLQPSLAGLLTVRQPFLRKVWGLLTVSVAAQLGTAPLVLLYFSRFSTHFLLTNLWVIPWVTLVMYGALFLLLLTPFPAWQEGWSKLVNGMLQWQNAGLQWIEQLPYASLEGIHIMLWEVVLFYGVLWLGWRAFRRGTANGLLLFLGTCGVGLWLHVAVGWLAVPHTGVAFYAARGCTAIHCLTPGPRSWLVSSDSLEQVASLKRSLTPYWRSRHLSEPYWVPKEYHTSELCVKEQLIQYAGKRIGWLTDQRWHNKLSPKRLSLDYLLITRHYRGGIGELLPLFQLNTVIVEAALPERYRQRIQAECDSLNLAYQLLKEQSYLEYTW